MTAVAHTLAAALIIGLAYGWLTESRRRIAAHDRASDERANAAWWRALANEHKGSTHE